MKLKNHIFNNNFVGAIQEFTKNKLPLKTSYGLAKFMRQLWEKEEIYIWERNRIILDYWENNKLLPEHKWFQEWIDKLNELLQIEEEYDIEPIKLPEDIEISPQHLIVLENNKMLWQEQPKTLPMKN